jgi:hypothetical protein
MRPPRDRDEHVKYWELVVCRKIEGDPPRFVNTRVGMVFENDKGNLSIKLDAGFSIHNSIGVTINGFVPRPKQASFGGGYNSGTRPATPPPRPAAPSPASGTAEEEWEV